MKKITLILFTAFFLFGCAGTGVNPDYQAYLDARTVAIKNAQPIISMECPPGGCNFTKLEYFGEPDLTLSQKTPHPGWMVASTAIKYGALGFVSYYAFDFLGTAVNAAGDSYSHSFNEVAGDYQYSPTRVGASDHGSVGDTAPWFGDDYSENQDYNYEYSFNPIDNSSLLAE